MTSIGKKLNRNEVDETIRGADQESDGRIYCKFYSLSEYADTNFVPDNDFVQLMMQKAPHLEHP